MLWGTLLSWDGFDTCTSTIAYWTGSAIKKCHDLKRYGALQGLPRYGINMGDSWISRMVVVYFFAQGNALPEDIRLLTVNINAFKAWLKTPCPTLNSPLMPKLFIRILVSYSACTISIIHSLWSILIYLKLLLAFTLLTLLILLNIIYLSIVF